MFHLALCKNNYWTKQTYSQMQQCLMDLTVFETTHILMDYIHYQQRAYISNHVSAIND